jgi:hypothetical protein
MSAILPRSPGLVEGSLDKALTHPSLSCNFG